MCEETITSRVEKDSIDGVREKIGVVSDIHGNVAALEAVIKDLRRNDVNTVVNLGDIVSGALWPRETLELLMPLDWITVRGNHDRHIVEGDLLESSDWHAYQSLTQEQLLWLGRLEPTASVRRSVGAVHGSLRADDEYLLHSLEGPTLRPSQADELAERMTPCAWSVLFCGHSHLPGIAHTPSGCTVVNPGSVGLPAYVDDDEQRPHVVENGDPAAKYAIVDLIGPRFAGAVWRNVPYDHELASRTALRNGRPDVAFALRTGRIRG